MNMQTTPQQEAWAALLQRIREDLEKPGNTQASIARTLGVNRSAIFKWLSGELKGRRVSIDDMRRYFSRLCLDSSPYFGSKANEHAVSGSGRDGEDSPPANKAGLGARLASAALRAEDNPSADTGGGELGRLPSERLSPEGEYCRIPWLEATASMGGGSVATSKALTAHLAFRADWLRGKGSLKGMVVINASGDSMSPTIPDGAVVLINENDKRPVNGGIFFVCYGEELFLKRLRTDKSGRVTHLISDLDGWEKNLEPAEYFEIIGRALWYAKEL